MLSFYKTKWQQLFRFKLKKNHENRIINLSVFGVHTLKKNTKQIENLFFLSLLNTKLVTTHLNMLS